MSKVTHARPRGPVAQPRPDLPTPVSRLVAWVPLVGTAVLGAAYLLSRPAYYRVLQEDRLVEWAQFGLCAFSALVAAFATHALMTAPRRPVAAALVVVFGVGMLLLAGEEISWGQRVFAFATPADLAAVNQQAELNIHNVGSGGISGAFKLVSLALGVVGVAWILASRRWRAGPASLYEALRPPASALPGFLAMALYQPFSLLTTIAVNPVSRLQEWAEVCLFLSLTATIAVVYLRAHQHGRGRSPGSALLYLAVGVSAVTLVFAVLTAYHGITPGNVLPLQS